MQYLTVKQVAERMNMSVLTIRRHIRSGRLVAMDWGTGQRHHWRISEEALDLLKARLELPPAPVLYTKRRKHFPSYFPTPR